MDASACPDRTLLTALVIGDLAGAVLEAVARHVDACLPCQARLRALDVGADPLFAGLGRPDPAAPYL